MSTTQPRTSSLIDFDLLANAVDERRRDLGMTAREAAAAARVDPSKFSNLRAGRALSLDNLLLVCAWLGSPVEAFLREGAPSWVGTVTAQLASLDPARVAELRDETDRRAERKAALAVPPDHG